MREISLGQRKFVLVDDKHYKELMKYKWSYNKRDNCPRSVLRNPEIYMTLNTPD
jgi:hypothetical protein